MTSVEEFLSALDMERYLDSFVENEIDVSLLSTLTSDDLVDLGVTIIGHRRRMLNAIAELSSEPIYKQVENSAPRQDDGAERRQLTIMFVDLVGSTAMSESLDPEDMNQIIGDFQRVATEIFKAHDGYIARFMGDGIMVHFGYPQANEDDSERSVRAGLELVEAVNSMEVSTPQKLSVRIGIATGRVVMGELFGSGEATERRVVGDTPNLAARLEAMAKPNTVVVSPTTRRLIEGLFEFKDLGSYDMKGISGKVAVSQAIRESKIQNRFRARHGSKPLQLVGRMGEMASLTSCWEEASTGNAQIAFISGEAGIGKSHLTEALIESVEREGGQSLRYFGSSQHQTTPFLPVIQQLKYAADFQPNDTAELRLKKISGVIGNGNENFFNGESDRAAKVIARLLSVPMTEENELDKLSGLELKQETIATLIHNLLAHSKSGPLLLVVEDAHWLDPSTLEFIDAFIQSLSKIRIMLVMNFRPEFTPSRIDHDIDVTSVSLTKLQHSEAALVVREVASNYALSDELVKEILFRTDGIPLFVEEMTRTIIESGHITLGIGKEDTGIPELAIPTSLQDSLMARLDRLDTAKEIAQIGAVIGRTFSLEVLQHIVPVSKDVLQAGLDELVEKRLTFRQNSSSGQNFTFRHALLRDAAYESLLKSRRQAVHLLVAQTLSSKFPGLVASQPQTIAYHFCEADEHSSAFGYWLQAGEKSLRAAAAFEAVDHLKQALAAADKIKNVPGLNINKIHAWTHLGAAYLMAKGQGATEVKNAYNEAWELCKNGELDEQSFPVLFGLWRYYLINANLETALEAGQQLLTVAKQGGTPAMKVASEMSMAITLFQSSKLEEAFKFAQTGCQTMRRYPEIRAENSVFLIGQDPEVACFSTMAMCDCLLGFGERALSSAKNALRIANEQQHGFHICAAHFWTALIHMLRSNPNKSLESANSVWEASQSASFPMWLVLSQVVQGAAACQIEPSTAHIEKIKTALRGMNDQNIERFLPLAQGLLADCYYRMGMMEDGLEAVNTALVAVDEMGERWFEPELFRIRAILLWKSNKPHEEIDIAFKRALDLAQTKTQRLAELNIAIDYAAFLKRQHKDANCDEIIQPIRGWFENQKDAEMLKRIDRSLMGQKT